MSISSFGAHYNVTPSTINPNTSHDSLVSSNFRITPGIEPISANLYTSTPFSMSLSDNVLVSLGTFKDITFNMTIPRYTLPGDYKSFICVVTNETKCINLTLTVNRAYNFTVENIINTSVNTSSKGFVFLNLSNTGNSILNISISSTSPTLKFLQSSNITTFPGFNYTIPIFYDFPADLGIQKINITIRADDLTKIVQAYVNVSDNEPPKLIDIKYDTSVKTLKPFQIKVISSDNINVSLISIEFDKNNSFNLTLVDTNTYAKNISLINFSYTNFSLVIVDTSGNNYTQIFPIAINKLEGVKYFNYNPVELLYNFEYVKTIFSTENEIPLNISLLGFKMTPLNATYTISISGDSFSKRDVKTGETIVLDKVSGNVNLFFVSPNQSKFEGDMIIIPPEYVATNKTVKITGKVGMFNVIDSKNVTIGSLQKNCGLSFRGDVSNSSYTCCEEYPATYDFTDLSICTTERDYNEIKRASNAERDLALKQYSSANFWRWLFFFIALFGFIFGVLIYLVKTRKRLFIPRWVG